MPIWMRSSFLFFLSFFASTLIVGVVTEVFQSFFIGVFLFLLFLNYGVYYLSLKKVFIYSFVLLVGSFLGGILCAYQLHQIAEKEAFLRPYFLEPQPKMEVIVESLSQEKEHDRVYQAKLLSLDDKAIFSHILLRLTVDKNLDVLVGDTLEFSAQMFPFSGKERYILSQYQQDIYFQVNPIGFDVKNSKKKNPFFTVVTSLRTKLLEKIEVLFPHREALFLGGILIGARENMDYETLKNFNNSGLSHLIAVSGFNITIIIIFLSFLLQYLPWYIRVLSISLGIAFFVLLVGFSPSVIRAACMGVTTYFVTLSGRQVNTWALFVIILFGFVLYRPLSLLYDVSLQLSFLAVIGISSFYPIFEKKIPFLPKLFGIREGILMTFSASLTTLPILFINFGQFSIVAPLTNLLVGWTIPVAMLFGFLTVVGSFFFPVSSQVGAFITFLLLRYDTFVVAFFGKFSWSTISANFQGEEYVFCFGYFFLLVFLLLYFQEKKSA